MMSIHGSRLNSRESASASKARLCHICGDDFPKSALPRHQKSCIKKVLPSRIRVNLSRSAGNIRVTEGLAVQQSVSNLGLGGSKFRLAGQDTEVSHFEMEVRKPTGRASAPLSRRLHISRASIDQEASDRNSNEIAPELNSSELKSIHSKRPPSRQFNLMHRKPESPILETESRPISRTSFVQKESKKSMLSNSNLDGNISRSPHAIIQTTRFYDSEQQEILTSINKEQKESDSLIRKDSNSLDNHATVPVENYHENDEIENLDVSKYLALCSICNRKFMEDRLQKHIRICSKTNTKVRKVFDVRAARVEGTDHAKYVLSKKPEAEQPKPKKSNWRAKHAAFQNMLMSSRDKKIPIIPAAADPNPDYISCPSCDRRFNEEAGKRHIPICKEKAAKKAMERAVNMKSSSIKNSVVNSKDKGAELKRRIAYKPPSPVKAKK